MQLCNPGGVPGPFPPLYRFFFTTKQLLELFPCILSGKMRVGIHGYRDIRVSHNVLQSFRIHSTLSHLGTAGMSAHMRRDIGKLQLIDPIILLHHMVEVVLPVHGNHRLVILIPIEKSCLPVNNRFHFQVLSVIHDIPKSFHHFRRHWHISYTCRCLGRFEGGDHITVANRLTGNMDTLFLEVNITHSQTAELGNSKSCIEQNKESVIVLAEMIIIFYKFQKRFLLFSCDSISRDTVIYNYSVQFKRKWILCKQIVASTRLVWYEWSYSPFHLPVEV